MGDYRRSSGSRSSSRRGSAGRSSKARLNAVQSARNGSRRGRNKRRGDFDITQIIMYGIAVVILVICIALAVQSCGNRQTSTDPEETQETELEKEVTVDGVNITGMMREDAKEAVMSHFDWGMKVVHQEQEAEIPNLIEGKVDELLEEIYHGEPREVYEVSTDGLTENVKAAADAIADGWDVKPKNGGISSFDIQTGKFSFAEGEAGLLIDRDKLVSDIETALKEKNYTAVITAEAAKVQPEITAAQAREMYETLGIYTTKTTSNKDRNENIRLAAAALNGRILQPGESFSFNDATGARTLEKGYKPAGAYVNGVLVEEPGGGVCQVSSTLYNAVIFSGLKTTERHAHSYEPSYVTPGEDAMVSYGGPDMKFTNTSEFPIAIRASFSNQELTISIYGVQILEDGVKVRMHSEKIADIDPPPPTYEEDLTLQPGIEVVAKEPTLGSRWTTNLVISKDGEVISDEFFHNSSYRGKPATIKRNTSGTVISTEASSDGVLPPDESGASDTSMEGITPSSGEEQRPLGPGDPGPSGPAEEFDPPESEEPVSPGGDSPGSVDVTPGGGADQGPMSPAGQPTENVAPLSPGGDTPDRPGGFNGPLGPGSN